MGGSPSPSIMTGGTCQLIGIVPSWRRELFFSILLQRIEQTAFTAMLTVSLLGFQQSRFAQILKSSAHGGLRQHEFTGDCRDGRPAFAIFIGSIRKIDIDGLCTVGELHAIYEIKSAHQTPPAQVLALSLRLIASAMAGSRLSCRLYLLAREEVSAVCFCSDCF